MHKRLKTDLMSLAHEILQMKDKENVFALKEKSKEIYEKLLLLAFVEEYITTTPNLEETKEELLNKVDKALELKEIIDKVVEEKTEEKVVHQLKEASQEIDQKTTLTSEVEEIEEQPFDEIESLMFETTQLEIEGNNDVKNIEERKIMSLEEELQDTIPVDEIATLFDTPAPTKSLNDKLANNIQIGLNDRIAFVKNLFDGSQEDFNRVVSQLNTFKTEKEAKKFISKMVKPDYNWSEQEELEIRFIEIIERRFA
jgi:serine protease inhibitor